MWAVVSLGAMLMVFEVVASSAADDSKVNAATSRVETGARTIGGGVEETAKGIGQTVVEGAKLGGQKIQESGKAARPEASSAWNNISAGVVSFGQSVKTFVVHLFTK